MPRKKISYRTASKENYILFQKIHPEVDLSFMEWSTVLYTFNYAFRDHLLETGERGKMPWGFGDFMVCKKKKKRWKLCPDGVERINLSINWKATKELGKRVYHTNGHTEGFNFFWRWEPNTARFYNTTIWCFKPSRVTSRLLAHYLSQEPYQHRYLEWAKK